MKKLYPLVLMLVGLVAFVIITGCSDDKSSTGSQDDPQFQTFSELFGYADQSTGMGIQVPFLFLDTIVAHGAPAKLNGYTSLSAQDVNLTWLASTSYWYCTATMVDGEKTFYLTDSIQFRIGTTPVQYPNQDLLTQIISYASLVMAGPGIDTARVFQNLTMTYNPLTDILNVSGTGGTMAELNDGDCSVSFDYAQSFTNLQWYVDYMFSGNDEVNCPYGGALSYTGSISGQCVGSDNSVNGQWNVTGTFDNGTIHYTVSSGGTQWTVSEECSTGVTEELSLADTLFVENVLGDGGLDQFLDGFDIGLALMEEQGLIGPSSAPGKSRLGESALSDSVIVNVINSYAYTNGWHIFNFSAETINYDDTASIAGVDSIRCMLGGSAQQFIEDPLAMDSINHRAHVEVTASSSEGLVEATMDHRVTASITAGETDTTVSFLGTIGASASAFGTTGNQSVCEVSLSLDQAINNVVLDPNAESDCPLAGQVVSDFSMHLGCSSNDGLNNFVINGDWTVTATVNNNNTLTISYANDAGTASWTRIYVCDQASPSVLSFRHRRK